MFKLDDQFCFCGPKKVNLGKDIFPCEIHSKGHMKMNTSFLFSKREIFIFLYHTVQGACLSQKQSSFFVFAFQEIWILDIMSSSILP